jgi:hypothetical protein
MMCVEVMLLAYAGDGGYQERDAAERFVKKVRRFADARECSFLV